MPAQWTLAGRGRNSQSRQMGAAWGGPALPLGPTPREAAGLGQAWESAFLTSTAWGLGLRPALAYLCPWAAAWLKEFMSPCGVVEIPFLCMVPIKGSAPRSNSKLTSSKLPASPEKGFHKRIKANTESVEALGQGEDGHLLPTAAASCRGVSE